MKIIKGLSYDDEDNYVNLISLIVLLLHLLLNILMFTLIMASHAVFNLGVAPLKKRTFCPLQGVISEAIHHPKPGSNSFLNKIHITRQTKELEAPLCGQT